MKKHGVFNFLTRGDYDFMGIFKIKNTKFCRFIIVLILLLITIFPFVVLGLNFWEMGVRVGICLILLFVSVFLLIKFSSSAVSSELVLKIIEANNKKRTKFDFPENLSKDKIENNIKRIGIKCESTTVFPQPEILRYQFKMPITARAKGLETIISTYSIRNLTNEELKNIIKSAKSNSKNLKGKKKAFFLDSEQKKSPLKRIDIVLVFADSVDATLEKHLFNLLCKEDTDGFIESIILCVFNYENKTIVFNCDWLPDAFSQNYARNRGIRIIKNKILKRKLNFKNNQNYVEFKIEGIDTEQTVFQLLKNEGNQFVDFKKKTNKKFKNMKEGEIIFEDDFLYIKIGGKGIAIYSEIIEETKMVNIDTFDLWDYPKTNQIPKNTISKIQNLVTSYFLNRGYTVKFLSTKE